MNYQQAMDYLNGFSRSGKPVNDLSRFKGLMKELDNVQDKLKYIHIAGTNGKGSVSEYIALGLQEAGNKTGKFTSPYINRIEERIQLDGAPIEGDKLAHYVGKVKEAAEKTGCGDYSQFEILNAAAFLYYAEENCDYVVLEAGIGGLLDCTNIIDPLLSVITTVDLDHCGLLGNTVEEIAVHKAGIIKAGRTVITAPFQQKAVLEIIEKKAAEMGSTVITPKNEELKLLSAELDGTRFIYKDREYRTGMCGKHQMVNAAAAVEALRALDVSDECTGIALEKAAVPARMERLGGYIVDGAHNASGARAVTALMKDRQGEKTLIIGVLKSKDYKGILSMLLPIFDFVIAVDFFSPDAVPVNEIREYAKSIGHSCSLADSPEKAVNLAEALHSDIKMVCGSLYLCGKMRKAINNHIEELKNRDY